MLANSELRADFKSGFEQRAGAETSVAAGLGPPLSEPPQGLLPVQRAPCAACALPGLWDTHAGQRESWWLHIMCSSSDV